MHISEYIPLLTPCTRVLVTNCRSSENIPHFMEPEGLHVFQAVFTIPRLCSSACSDLQTRQRHTIKGLKRRCFLSSVNKSSNVLLGISCSSQRCMRQATKREDSPFDYAPKTVLSRNRPGGGEGGGYEYILWCP